MLHVIDAKYVSDYRIWVSFDDGSDGGESIKPSKRPYL
ncbi:hypothetical protein MAQ5080_01750 [Marinomonas aquimarina]|uniref:Uncharacterized protein n=1 Tax=Marinomonas aquimarina TaxID=295068 RepID=A0A1A8TCE3_9GAMM|nr:hypothetical protein MAQ5080_01750 [Marinomonas aquimarina]